MKDKNRKNGGVLVMVMIVMIAFTILAAGLYKLQETDAVEAVYVEQSNQAFWIAETGMQRALHRLRKEKTYRNNPSSLNEAVGNGTYSVNVAAVSGVDDTWNIVSTGTVRNVSRVLTLNPLLTANIGYAIMGLDGQNKLNKEGTINSNVYSYGELWANGRSPPDLSGEILALDGRNVDYTPMTSDDRVEMEIDDTDPDLDFTQSPAQSPSYTNIVVVEAGVTNTYAYLDLTGGKVVKVGPGDLQPSGEFQVDHGIIGNGTLIVPGADLYFSSAGSPYTVGDNATILVGGDVTAKKEGVWGADVLLYATGNMTVQKTGAGAGTTFLVEGNFTADKELDMLGLIFAEGNVQVDGDLTMEGSIIAGQEFWLKGGYDITYNGDYIPDDILENMIVYVTYATSPGTWNEVPAR